MTGKNPLGNSREPQAYEGNNIVVPLGGWQLIKSKRAPTTNDKKYPIGSIWIDTLASVSYQLVTAPGIWTVLGSGMGGDIQTLTGDTGGALVPAAGNINLLGTANQITSTGAGSTITFSLPAAITAPGSLTTTTTLAATTTVTGGTGVVATTGNIVATAGQVNAGTSMTAGTSITATLGNITATNGNLVLNTAGNKIVSTSVGTTSAAGANSFGTVTLLNGTVTVATTAVTASSIIILSRMTVGTTGANDLGILSAGTIVAGTSFDINAWTATNATVLQADDQSVIAWMIIN